MYIVHDAVYGVMYSVYCIVGVANLCGRWAKKMEKLKTFFVEGHRPVFF